MGLTAAYCPGPQARLKQDLWFTVGSLQGVRKALGLESLLLQGSVCNFLLLYPSSAPSEQTCEGGVNHWTKAGPSQKTSHLLI